MTNATPDEAVRAVRAVLDRWLQATMDGDADTLDSMLTEDYTYTHATTAVEDTREEWLESFRTGGRSYHIYAVDDLRPRVFPGAVVLTGSAHQEMSPRGEWMELNTRFLSVWVPQDGAWKLAGWQATRLPSDG